MTEISFNYRSAHLNRSVRAFYSERFYFETGKCLRAEWLESSVECGKRSIAGKTVCSETVRGEFVWDRIAVGRRYFFVRWPRNTKYYWREKVPDRPKSRESQWVSTVRFLYFSARIIRRRLTSRTTRFAQKCERYWRNCSWTEEMVKLSVLPAWFFPGRGSRKAQVSGIRGTPLGLFRVHQIHLKRLFRLRDQAC